MFNLRGNARTSGEDRRKEAGNVFGEGTRTPVTISLMVKDPSHTGPCELYYHDIGDYLSREEKLAIIENTGSIEGLEWHRITPNEEGDWINQRDPAFDRFISLGDKSGDETNTIFSTYSQGLLTGRDSWAYNFSHERLSENMSLMIDAYNEEVENFQRACEGLPKEKWPRVEDVISTDPKRISWTHNLKQSLNRGKAIAFDESKIVPSIYRPFSRAWLYFDRLLNERVYLMPKLFPTPEHENVVISVLGKGATKPFSVLASNTLPDYEMISKGQCFPMYWYERMKGESGKPQGELGFGSQAQVDEHGYVRHEAITDWALEHFRKHYGDESITKEDIFWYVYGVLHSPEYRSRFASNLKKQLARIPLARDFWAFSKAGRKLGELHLNYENVEPWPVKEETKLIMEDADWRVTKMRF
ncbi:MAG: damage-inducible protein, partial [Gammaproteobacteria bacterium]